MVAIAVHFVATSANLDERAYMGRLEANVLPHLSAGLRNALTVVYLSWATTAMTGSHATTCSLQASSATRRQIPVHVYPTPWEDRLCDEPDWPKVLCSYVWRHGGLADLIYVAADTHDHHPDRIVDRLQQFGLYQNPVFQPSPFRRTSLLPRVHVCIVPPSTTENAPPTWIPLRGD